MSKEDCDSKWFAHWPYCELHGKKMNHLKNPKMVQVGENESLLVGLKKFGGNGDDYHETFLLDNEWHQPSCAPYKHIQRVKGSDKKTEYIWYLHVSPLEGLFEDEEPEYCRTDEDCQYPG